MRAKAASILATTLLVAACSGSGGGSADPAAPGPTVGGAPTTTATTTPETPPSTAPPSTAVTGTTVADDRSAAEVIAALEADPTTTPLDHALAEYAAIFEPLPGTAAVPQDGTAFVSVSHVFATIDEYRDQLTVEQATAFDAKVAEIDALEPLDAFAIGGDGTDAAPTGFAGRHGFSGSASSGRPASERVRTEVALLGEQIRTALGGESWTTWVEIVPLGSLGISTGAKAFAPGIASESRLRMLAAGVDADCLILLTEEVVADGALLTDSNARGLVTHEMFHCWQFGKLGWDAPLINQIDDWAKEGMAAFFGEQFGGVTRFNSGWWSSYLHGQLDAEQNWPLYESSYAAIGFWSRVHEGSDIVAAMERTLAAAPDDDAMYEAAIADMGDGVAWLAAGTVQNSSWGSGWTASGPGLPPTARLSSEDSVTVDSGRVVQSAARASQRNAVFLVDGDAAAEGSVMRLALDGTGVARVEDVDVVFIEEISITEWCLGVCVCPDGASAFAEERVLPLETLVTAALVGRTDVGAGALVEVEAFDPDEADCEEPETTVPPLVIDVGVPDGGFIGTWRANPEAVALMYEEASAFGDDVEPLDVAAATGDVFLTFNEGGSGSLEYQAVTLVFADAPIDQLTLNGQGSFRWGVSGGQMLIDGVDFEFAVVTPALGPDPFVLTDEDVPSSGVTKLTGQVVGDSLTITASEGSAGAVFFPVSWVRQ